jgi:hypothetical protein
MEVARNLDELKECVSVWGLRENRREHPRYKVDIQGNYFVEQNGTIAVRDRCTLVDVNREGVAIKIRDNQFKKGTKLHLQFYAGQGRLDVVGKVVHIKPDGEDYLVGIQSTTRKVDIAQQLLG